VIEDFLISSGGVDVVSRTKFKESAAAIAWKYSTIKTPFAYASLVGQA